MIAPLTALLLAATLGASPAVAKRVKIDPTLGPALFEAIATEDVARAKALLSKGADPDAVGPDGNAVLLHATFADLVEVVRALLDRGAKPDPLAAGVGGTPLWYAASRGSTEIVALLLDRKANLEAVESTRRTPLYAAAEAGREDAARLLLDRGAKVDAASRRGETPLVAAVAGGHEPVARLLLSRGADPNRGSEEGEPLVVMALRARSATLAADLLAHGADPDVNHAGRSLLDFAFEDESGALVEALVEHGVNPDVRMARGMSALLTALSMRHLPAARAIAKRANRVNDSDPDSGLTPLMIAANLGDADLVRLLLSKGADARARSAEGTPVIDFAKGDAVAEIQRVLEN